MNVKFHTCLEQFLINFQTTLHLEHLRRLVELIRTIGVVFYVKGSPMGIYTLMSYQNKYVKGNQKSPQER